MPMWTGETSLNKEQEPVTICTGPLHAGLPESARKEHVECVKQGTLTFSPSILM